MGERWQNVKLCTALPVCALLVGVWFVGHIFCRYLRGLWRDVRHYRRMKTMRRRLG